ncbi:MAG: leuB [Firmicutes bacterium]|nr:leuB [Bacillota bacterium]
MDFKIAIIPGDGIGVDVVSEGVKVLERIGEVYGHNFKYEHMLVGGCCIDKHGTPIMDESIEKCKSCDAILFGAVGGPKWDALPREQRPERGLARLRREFNLFANLRPAKIYEDLKDKSPLKNSIIEKGIDIMLIRDLTGGIYFNEKGRREGKYGLEAYDVECYSVMEVTRVAKKAFELALQRKKRVISVDKSNALESSKIWRDTVTEVAKEYPEVELKHMLVDKAAMELACNPSIFDVILTTSIFGDILSDEAGVTTGSVGMLASASLNENNFGLYEPIHGTAPDIAGKGIANPLATIVSVAMMLEIALNLPKEAAAIDRAIKQVLSEGYRTPDIYTEGTKKVTTIEMGTLTAAKIS